MRIAQEEIFGPVLSVIPFADEDEAVAIANDTPYGLAAGLWTQAPTRFVRRTHVARGSRERASLADALQQLCFAGTDTGTGPKPMVIRTRAIPVLCHHGSYRRYEASLSAKAVHDQVRPIPTPSGKPTYLLDLVNFAIL